MLPVKVNVVTDAMFPVNGTPQISLIFRQDNKEECRKYKIVYLTWENEEHEKYRCQKFVILEVSVK